jgi:N-acetylmuramoyl-L-alanine amidase
VKLQEEYAKKAGRVDKGVHRQSIWVLWRTSMPSILTEIGYLTNPLEEQFLGSEKGQDYLAKAIFRGLRKYKDEQEGSKKDYNDDLEKQEPLENENIKAGNLPGQKAPDDEDDEEDEKKVKTDSLAQNKNESPKKDSVTVKDTPKEEIKKDHEPEDTSVNAVKEEVKDGKGQDIDLKKTDTTLTAKAIVENAKKKAEEEKAKQLAEEIKKKEAAEALKKKEEENKKKESENKKNEEISFRVQFASSDVELNLKQEKFKDIKNGSYYKLKNVYKYTSGNFKTMKEAVAHQNELREKGYKDCFVIAMKNGERMDVQQARKESGQ